MQASRTQVLVLNNIAPAGLSELPDELYDKSDSVSEYEAVLVRSANMHEMTFPKTLRAVGRAGAGTNNIPVQALGQQGIPVFNAPGANANAVKELVLAALLMSARNLPEAMQWLSEQDADDPELETRLEGGKKAYAGFELAGKTLGVVGLGRIGCLVADAAIAMNMAVIGHDPGLTVDAAWSLPAQVRKAGDLAEMFRQCDFISLHVPLIDDTRRLINAQLLQSARPGLILVNFSRAGVVDEDAVVDALSSGHLARYMSDFPSACTLRHKQVTALPHLGASTREAEENCAIMVARNLRDFLENGNVAHSVNFPDVSMPRESNYRVCIVNANVPNMLGQISTVMANASLNIHNMINKSRGELAYTLVDVDSPVMSSVVAELAAVDGVLAVRYLAQDA